MRVIMLLAALLVAPLHAQDKAAPPKVTLTLEKATAAEAAAQIGNQSGITVLTLGEITGDVALDLKDIEVEAAVKALAEAVKGSWLRAYVIETEPPAEPPTADQLADRLRAAGRDWFLRRSETELDLVQQRAREAAASQPKPPQPQPQPITAGNLMIDQVDMLKGPYHFETISLQLAGLSVPEAFDQFRLQSGYPVLVEEGLEGTLTLDVKDEKLSKVLEALAGQLHAQWHVIYLVGQPREMTPDEMERRVSEGLQQAAGWFFQQPLEKRQQIMQQATDRVKNLSPDVKNEIRQSPWAPRITQRVMGFVTTLTPEQRREVSPLLKAFVQIVGQ